MRKHINEKEYLCYGLCKVQDRWRWQWLGLQQRRSLRWYRPNLRETSWMQTNQQKKTGARCVCYSGQLLFSNWFNANVLTTRPCIYLLFRGRILMRNSFRRPPPQNTHPHFFYSGGEGVAEQDVLSIFSVFHLKKTKQIWSFARGS